ncbi:hypothetical protein GCM10009555_061040 [Acrocarpospora macrocephala]|uniref:Uncharacterized protein n=1 Tax=Acrocarpospora macrocephala TaxID=150177 RepID=A0A5M3WTT3_9ACTN|nr:hypothetical protein [Acrocarpospora macrocephala]GES09548.1 hypothetical protein Amac_031440 [Acrocarpospora macrocephala]
MARTKPVQPVKPKKPVKQQKRKSTNREMSNFIADDNDESALQQVASIDELVEPETIIRQQKDRNQKSGGTTPIITRKNQKKNEKPSGTGNTSSTSRKRAAETDGIAFTSIIGDGGRRTRSRMDVPPPIQPQPDVIVSPPAPAVDPEVLGARTTAKGMGHMKFTAAVLEGKDWALQVVRDLGVNDFQSSEGLRAWFEKVEGLTAASTAPELLRAMEDVDPQLTDVAWKCMAEILGFEESRAEDVLARTAVEHAADGDTELQRQIAEYCAKAGLDHERYLRSYGDFGGLMLFGDATKQEVSLAPGREASIILERSLQAHMKALHAEFKQRTVVNEHNHHYDRIAWILASLKSARECVALITDMGQEIRFFANKPDMDLGVDFIRLLNAAINGSDTCTDGVEKLFREMADQNLGRRLKEGERLSKADLKSAERRLRKTLDLLHHNHEEWSALRVLVHNAGNRQHVHAETQAADAVLDRRDRFLGEEASDDENGDLVLLEGTLREKQALVKRAEFKRLVENAHLALGISKLCCFKCWLMLLATGQKGVGLPASGTHGKTYGWPAPASMAKASVIRAFLRIDPATTDKNQLVVLNALRTKKGRAMVVNFISTWGGKGELGTDYASSEEDEGLELTIWERYYQEKYGSDSEEPEETESEHEEMSTEDLPNEDLPNEDDLPNEELSNDEHSESGDPVSEEDEPITDTNTVTKAKVLSSSDD